MRHVKLYVGGLHCRRCVREVTAWLRDVPGVATVVADVVTGTVVVGGTMVTADVLAAFRGPAYRPELLDDAPADPGS